MIFKSIAPRSEIPGIDIPTFYFGAAKLNGATPDRLAFVDGETGRSQTFGHLEIMSIQIASGLVNNCNIGKGDIVALFSSNHIHYASCLFGVIASGGVCCTINSIFNASELEYQLADCKAKVMIVGERQLPVVAEVIKRELISIPAERIFVLSNNPADSKFKSISKLLSDSPFTQYRITSIKESSDTAAVILYSSGTTKLPKGVMLSHRNIISYTVQSASMLSFYGAMTNTSDIESERSFAILPFAHVYGLTSLIANSIAAAKTQYLMSKFSIDGFLAAVEKYKIEIASLVPDIIAQIIKHPNLSKYDLSSLKLFGSGAAPLPSGIHEKIVNNFPATFINGYGMSETSSGICSMVNYKFKAGSVGFLYTEMEAKIIGPNGEELGYNQEGELCLRGPSIMMGYLNRPEENAKVFDKDGFFHTGDVAYIDDENRIFITDRIKELIKYKGFQVPPAELEGILMDHSSIKDAAVIGIQDPERHTEVPKAYVVIQDNVMTRIGNDKKAVKELCVAIEKWIEGKVSKHKRLRGGVEPISSIPRNVTGKILRRELRTKHKAEHGSKL